MQEIVFDATLSTSSHVPDLAGLFRLRRSGKGRLSGQPESSAISNIVKNLTAITISMITSAVLLSKAEN